MLPVSRKLRTFQILEIAEPGDTASRAFDVFIFILIGINVLAVVLETVGDLRARYADWFGLFEAVSVAVFTVEYVLRLWSITVVPRFSRPVLGRLRYAFTPMLLVDVVAFAPFYLSFFVVLDLRFVLGVPVTPLTDLAHVLVLGDEEPAFGVLVDALGEVTRLDREALVEPGEGVALHREWILGVTPNAGFALDAARIVRAYA